MTHLLKATVHDGVGGAVGRAVDFLVGTRADGALWCDFETLAGCSVDWVSGHVVTSIAGLPDSWAVCEDVAAALLGRQRPSGGWGYHDRIPEDADTTACVLRALASAAFVSPHATRSAREFLFSHQVATGGYATYRRLDAIGAVIGEEDRRALRGWGSAHACVSANVVLALLESGVSPAAPGLAGALDYLERQRQHDGLWYSYWWNGPTFATYHALLALTLAGRADARAREGTARALLALRNGDSGWGDDDGTGLSHPMATALALLTLALAPPAPPIVEAAERAAGRLLDWQRADGSWPTVPILRIPDAHVVDPRRPVARASRPGTGVVVADQRRVYTTAAVAHALELYRRTHVGAVATDA